jgi:hypothetical protein
MMSDHEDVLRRLASMYKAEAISWQCSAPADICRQRVDAINAVLAEAESLRAERDEAREADRASVAMVRHVEQRTEKAAAEVERLREALREVAAFPCPNPVIQRSVQTGRATSVSGCGACVSCKAREALALSAPEPAPAEPWVQCTDHMNLAKPRCLGGCRTRAEHERYTAKPEPAPAPTERVCRCAASAVAVCAQYVEGDTGYWCGNCFHDRACHTGEQR